MLAVRFGAGRRVDCSCGWVGRGYASDQEMSYAFHGHRTTAEPEPPDRRPGARDWKLGVLSVGTRRSAERGGRL